MKLELDFECGIFFFELGFGFGNWIGSAATMRAIVLVQAFFSLVELNLRFVRLVPDQVMKEAEKGEKVCLEIT